jgi:hypothetical protein
MPKRLLAGCNIIVITTKHIVLTPFKALLRPLNVVTAFLHFTPFSNNCASAENVIHCQTLPTLPSNGIF